MKHCTWFVAFVLTGVFIMLLISSCVRTEGILKINGRIIDGKTGAGIPGRKIIVKAVLQDRELPIETIRFEGDSAGHFVFILKKVKDVYSYDFNIVGDSNYTFKTIRFHLAGLRSSAGTIFLSLDRLTPMKIKIYRSGKTPGPDTLSLFWDSDGINGRQIFQYKIENYQKNNPLAASAPELRWIGGKVNSTVYTRVFAEKKTRLMWQLKRKGRTEEFIDTITCKRNMDNIVYFKY